MASEKRVSAFIASSRRDQPVANSSLTPSQLNRHTATLIESWRRTPKAICYLPSVLVSAVIALVAFGQPA
jgi:hypothetical protein